MQLWKTGEKMRSAATNMAVTIIRKTRKYAACFSIPQSLLQRCPHFLDCCSGIEIPQHRAADLRLTLWKLPMMPRLISDQKPSIVLV
jgi:hypothetical protein